MEALAEEQSVLGGDLEVALHNDLADVNTEDDFDLDIGGGDIISAEDHIKNEETQPVASTQGQDDDSYTYEGHEHAAHGLASERYQEEQEEQEQGHDHFELDVSGMSTPNETDDLANPVLQDNGVDEEEGKFADDEVNDEIFYEETAGEFEGLDNISQRDAGQGDGHTSTATSVENLHQEGVAIENPVHEPNQGVSISALGSQTEETAEKNATPAGIEVEDLEELVDKADDENNNAYGNVTDGLSAKHGVSTPADEDLQAQPDWDEDEEEISDNTRPNVIVSYQSTEYFLFAKSPDQDPDDYFLDDFDLLDQPLSQVIARIREVILDDVKPSQEIFMKLEELGIEFGESTTTDFLETTTLSQILDVHKRLVRHDGGSASPGLYINLQVRPHCLRWLAELTNGADEGKGLSQFEGEIQFELSEDIYSDNLSSNGQLDDSEEVSGATVDASGAEEPTNPFQLTEDQLQSVDDESTAVFVESNHQVHDGFTFDGETVDTNSDEKGIPADTCNHNVSEHGNADMHHEDSVDKDLQATPKDSNIIDDVVEEGWGDVQGLDEDYGGEGVTDGGAASSADQTMEQSTEQTAEMLNGHFQEEHEHTDGEKPFLSGASDCVANSGDCFCYGCYDSSRESIPTHSTGLQNSFLFDPDLDKEITCSPWGFLKRAELYSLASSNSEMRAGSDCSFLAGNGSVIIQREPAADKKLQDNTAEAADDEDYLDLDDDGRVARQADDVEITKDNAAGHSEPLDMARQMSHSSSATATLDGENNGHGGDALSIQEPSGPSPAQHLPEVDASQDDVDEIDWKNDGDEDIDVADQNPATLSPSSPSAKRGRQEDGGYDGQGDENAIKRRRTEVGEV